MRLGSIFFRLLTCTMSVRRDETKQQQQKEPISKSLASSRKSDRKISPRGFAFIKIESEAHKNKAIKASNEAK